MLVEDFASLFIVLAVFLSLYCLITHIFSIEELPAIPINKMDKLLGKKLIKVTEL